MARITVGVAEARQLSSVNDLRYSRAVPPGFQQRCRLRSHSLLPNHPAVELPAACRQALPSMRTAAGLCAPEVTQEAPRARLCASEAQHRDGRQPVALKAAPSAGFKAFTARKSRAKKRKTAPPGATKKAAQDWPQHAQGVSAMGLTNRHEAAEKPLSATLPRYIKLSTSQCLPGA